MNAEYLLLALLWISGLVTKIDCRREHERKRHGLSSPRRLPTNNERCPPCDVSKCSTLTAESCGGGRIVRDWCNCCLVCADVKVTDVAGEANPTMSSSPIQIAPHTPHGLNEQSEACAKITCPKFQVCMLNIQGIPMCRCPTKFWCMKGERNPVCGEDDVTYKSKCFLRMAECESNRNIAIKRRGKCLKSDKDRQLRIERQKQKQLKSQQKMEKKKMKQEKMQRKMKKYTKKERKQRKKRRRRPKNKRWMTKQQRRLFR
ncbi:hypothetical protein LSH36_31g00019 [Paralvinella palmiformis]|uniref:Kazal-like domain-containing protein n=1 Tax=Paralvinella palmiformis TaxID=53620 RepID=A0AAD9K8T0_9ANNE|nr:hypothetical protein LSH36_31g00019 [Paralvinella palmiformis]